MDYKEIIESDGVEETITIKVTLPLNPRLAQIIDRSAIRDFTATYNEGDETITFEGDTVHSI